MEHFSVSGVMVPMKCSITLFDYNCETHFTNSKINLCVEKNWKEILPNITCSFYHSSRIIGGIFFFFFLLSKEILKETLGLDH